MNRRNLEFRDGKSEKFWNIQLEGDSHTVNYGRIGTAGQTKTKSFAGAAEARKSFDKLVNQKLKKGYADAGGGVAVAVEAPPEVEAEVKAQDDVELKYLEFSDAKSHKFWQIELQGAAHTVTYGKVGTSGQSKSKTFSDNAEARKSFDKLLAQKLKKGYAEAAPATEVAKPKVSAKSSGPSKSEAEQGPYKTRSGCVLRLEPEDWFWAKWRDNEPIAPLPFSLEELYAKRKTPYRSWSKAHTHLSFEEALYRLMVVDASERPSWAEELWETLKSRYTYPLSLAQLFEIVDTVKERDDCHYSFKNLKENQWPRPNDGSYWHLYRALLRVEDWVETFLTKKYWRVEDWYILGTFTPAQHDVVQEVVRRLGVEEKTTAAAALGMHDELRQLVASWTPETRYTYAMHYAGLGDPDLMYREMKRLNVCPWGSVNKWNYYEATRAYLANTEDWGLDLLEPGLLVKMPKTMLKKRFKVLALVESPRTVPLMLTVINRTQIPDLAHSWLAKHASFTVPELIRLSQEATDLERAEWAVEALRRLQLKKPNLVEPHLTQELRAQLCEEETDDGSEAIPTLEQLPKVEVPPLTEGSIPFVRKLNLHPLDWYLAAWRKTEPLERVRKPFDKVACAHKIKDLYQRTVRGEQRLVPDQKWAYFTELPFAWPHGHPASLSQEEALFWTEVSLGSPIHERRKVTKERLLEHLKEWDAEAPKSSSGEPITSNYEYLVGRLREKHGEKRFEIAWDLPPILTALLSSREYLQLWLFECADEEKPVAACRPNPWSGYLSDQMANCFRWGYIPYMTEPEREELQAMLRPHLDKTKEIPEIAQLAQWLGMPECQELFDSGVSYSSLFGLANKDAVIAAYSSKEPVGFKDLKSVRAWLAHTEHEHLEPVRRTLEERHKALREMRRRYNEKNWPTRHETINFDQLWALLSSSPSPEMAVAIASADAQVPAGAKRDDVFLDWLHAHPECALPATLHMAIGEGELADYAVRYLRRHYLTHGAQDLLAHMSGYQQAVQRVLKLKILEPFRERQEGESVADWLPRSEVLVEPTKTDLQWINFKKLPPVEFEDHTFTPAQVKRLIQALIASTPEDPHPHVTNLRKLATSSGCFDDITWHLFELWLGEGGPSKQRWAMEAWGHLATEQVAHKVFPLMKKWPGERHHKWSLSGLAALQAMGTDGALTLINSLATKLRFKGLKEASGYAMDRIARRRGLTREQLADRVIPDCELDEKGQRVFDFGPRQFSVVLTDDLKIMLRDGEGSLVKSLPKPGAKDDPEKAKAAAAHFKLLKSQLGEMLKIQPLRLENAMSSRRFWTPHEFETFLVRHPFMSHLCRRLIWGTYKEGELQDSFRVSESFDFANIKDDEFKLDPKLMVGVVHTLDLTAEQNESWRAVLLDYEIFQPFPQLKRPTYSLEEEEALEAAFERLSHNYHAHTFKPILESRNWKPEQGSSIGYHQRHFEHASVTVRVDWNPSYHVTMAREEHVCAERLEFSKGGKALELSQVDPVILSEVMYVLALLKPIVYD